MNFRTTLFLLMLVAAVGIGLYLNEHHEKPKAADDTTQHKLLDVEAPDVTKLAITNSDDKRTVLEKSGSDWKLVEPVTAPAKGFEVDDLVRAIVALQSRGQADASTKSSGGLDHPSFVVELTGKAGKVTKLTFGDKSTVGDSLYVLVNDNAKPDVVETEVYSKLDKPASSFRETRIVSTNNDQIKQLAVTDNGKTIKLEKKGDAWQLVEPINVPADSATVSDILSGITSLNATRFLDNPGNPSKYELSHPSLAVWFSTKAPTTQPAAAPAPTATQMPDGEILRFGGYEDVLKKNVYASVNGKEVAIVTASSEKSFQKTPLDLRSRDVATLDPDTVASFTISVDRPATTQPTTRPADLHEYTIERHKEAPPVLGPALPPGVTLPTTPATQPANGEVATTQPAKREVATTQPSAPTTRPTVVAATQPSAPTTRPSEVATTRPATQPAQVATTQAAATPLTPPTPIEPAGKWLFTSGNQGSAEEGQVQALLDSFHPLHVEKYVENPATSQPAATVNLTIHTIATKAGENGTDYVFRFVDRGNETPLVGSYKDLAFELDRSLLEKLTGDFKTKKAPAPSTPPPSFPGAGGRSPFGG